MSLEAFFLITDERTVLNACQGWMPPLAQPRSVARTNPFTGTVYEVNTLVPEKLESNLREPTFEDIETGLEDKVHDQLSKSRPLAVVFTVSHDFYEMIKETPPFLYGDVHGEVHEIKRVEREKEAAVLQHFQHLSGDFMEDGKRHAEGLSLFIYIFA
jgi:hypothetical protein